MYLSNVCAVLAVTDRHNLTQWPRAMQLLRPPPPSCISSYLRVCVVFFCVCGRATSKAHPQTCYFVSLSFIINKFEKYM